MSQEEYNVEDILEKRISNKGKIEYLVKWEGYQVSESTWEPFENLSNSMDIIKEFEIREEAKKLSIQDSNKIINENTNKDPVNNAEDKKKNNTNIKNNSKKNIFNANTETNFSRNTNNNDDAANNSNNNNNTNGNSNSNSKNSNNDSKSNSQNENSEDYLVLMDIEDNFPKKIRSVKKIEGELCSLVEWEERSDGLTPDPAYIPSVLLRKINPKILIEFYESKIKFVNKK